MNPVETLFARNRSWANRHVAGDPAFFRRHAQGQQPHTLWLGCSDSRVAPELLTGSRIGELFVHRNIANMIDENDESLMSVMLYAIDELKVTNIILCGHYGCGGVLAALKLGKPVNHSGNPLTRRVSALRQGLEMDISGSGGCQSHADVADRLVEAHLRIQFARLHALPVVQEAWAQQQPLTLWGCVFDIGCGHLKELMRMDGRDDK
ncbi:MULTISPECIES: carbonic anhydrase [Tenebrionibacter/Tenebrionicola group]|uniref:carbonic anhydrase n=2 Tax=Tenebrionibacter/Tenebrionicola group TaxID=2969848 RepID=A0A8K0XX45_9ENTR|nr:MULTISPECIES: carbonic anhydrase [Tenebrionibacter/Tenebrionicola group]MBK4715263.1 carbonic anhydrase [Tenebrionibacter intestinalis]MBV4413056.1 carbonic anhydrase [Tenebrionicola larvae]MBV5096009.1 carbonic anhydrase [Tenebrionicola larvae]